MGKHVRTSNHFVKLGTSEWMVEKRGLWEDDGDRGNFLGRYSCGFTVEQQGNLSHSYPDNISLSSGREYLIRTLTRWVLSYPQGQHNYNIVQTIFWDTHMKIPEVPIWFWGELLCGGSNLPDHKARDLCMALQTEGHLLLLVSSLCSLSFLRPFHN